MGVMIIGENPERVDSFLTYEDTREMRKVVVQSIGGINFIQPNDLGNNGLREIDFKIKKIEKQDIKNKNMGEGEDYQDLQRFNWGGQVGVDRGRMDGCTM